MMLKLLLRSLCAALLFHSVNVFAQSLAFTFDDGPQLDKTPLMSPQERNQALLNALGTNGVSAALFVTVDNGANQPEGMLLAKAWGQAGHAVGNHTMTHIDLNNSGVSLTQYQKEILDCDEIIRKLPGYQKWFRYTYLREGNTLEKTRRNA